MSCTCVYQTNITALKNLQIKTIKNAGDICTSYRT